MQDLMNKMQLKLLDFLTYKIRSEMTKHKLSCFDLSNFLFSGVYTSVNLQPIQTNLVSVLEVLDLVPFQQAIICWYILFPCRLIPFKTCLTFFGASAIILEIV